ncbi:alginate export family protein [Sphingomonas sp. A2-49]|uniref:alginate export family protein n=1 Tax=Sphingomonas sp. A2-49 TaxID=1391375 RepID=UPI0021CFD139|nr:alginate export family protein [Sphingomonas sp. A2-49]MCU6455484.1 alginate export family protein [Sphingomonas sp. A2-49]
MRLATRLPILPLLSLAAPAAAQTITPLAEVRLRHEHVEQGGLPDGSDAVTARVRTGLQVSEGRWSALAEAQGNLAIVGDYYDGLHGPATQRPLVADPQNIALFRAQLQYRAPGLTVTAGRQRLALEDERFVGAAAIRNNAQTFDAVRAEATPIKGVKADVTYAWSVRTVWGIDGAGARQQAIGGDNVFATLGVATPVGTLTGFAYLVDQDEAQVQGYRLSSQTYGARLYGSHGFGKATLSWNASHARQSDYHRNPNAYAADYWLADVGLDLAGPRVGAGYEVLGASHGAAFTSFQTPLAAVFKFQGWTDRFNPTPPDGVRDLYASAGWNWKQLGRLKAVQLLAAYHRFESDRAVRHYGNALNLLAQAKVGRTTVGVRYADYMADRFATDLRKLWLQLDWTL